MRTDLSHLPPSTPEEIRAMTRRAGLDLPEELMREFIAAWPALRRWSDASRAISTAPPSRRTATGRCASSAADDGRPRRNSVSRLSLTGGRVKVEIANLIKYDYITYADIKWCKFGDGDA